METFNCEKHFHAFQWAISNNWKEKNYLYQSIHQKLETLVKEYKLSKDEILQELFVSYWERGHFEKYDSNKGSFHNWIAHYVNFYLNNIIKQYAIRSRNETLHTGDPLDNRNVAHLVYSDKDNDKEDNNFQPDFLIDKDNPESLLMAKELLESVGLYFDNVDIQYLKGELSLSEAAKACSLNDSSFLKRLTRRRNNFIKST